MSGLAARPSPPSASSPRSALMTASPAREADIIAFPTWSAAPSPAPGQRSTAVELHLLGGFRLLVGGELVRVGSSGERLLAAIACAGRQASRSHLARALWPDATTDRALATLRTVLYRLSRRSPVAVHVTSSHVQLSLGVSIDLEQTTRLAHRLLVEDSSVEDGLIDDALGANLYDDLLPEWDEEWLGDRRYRYRQLRLTALERLSTSLGAAGYHGAAIQAALAAVQADALRESAHETLIRAHLAQGNRHEAVSHYLTFRRILRDELGVEPPPALGRLLTGA